MERSFSWSGPSLKLMISGSLEMPIVWPTLKFNVQADVLTDIRAGLVIDTSGSMPLGGRGRTGLLAPPFGGRFFLFFCSCFCFV